MGVPVPTPCDRRARCRAGDLGAEREISTLARLAGRLPVAVPAPVYVEQPVETFPWPFLGARLLPGVESCDARLSDAERVRLARALRRLHDATTVSLVGELLPVDPLGRADMGCGWCGRASACGACARSGCGRRPPASRASSSGRSGFRRQRPRAVCHGDLHSRQVIVAEGASSGLVDGIDVCRADPAIDLPLVWSFFSPRGREAFLEESSPPLSRSPRPSSRGSRAAPS